jgi:hypothetical protein
VKLDTTIDPARKRCEEHHAGRGRNPRGRQKLSKIATELREQVSQCKYASKGSDGGAPHSEESQGDRRRPGRLAQ